MSKALRVRDSSAVTAVPFTVIEAGIVAVYFNRLGSVIAHDWYRGSETVLSMITLTEGNDLYQKFAAELTRLLAETSGEARLGCQRAAFTSTFGEEAFAGQMQGIRKRWKHPTDPCSALDLLVMPHNWRSRVHEMRFLFPHLPFSFFEEVMQTARRL